jgi:hypothetical protein
MTALPLVKRVMRTASKEATEKKERAKTVRREMKIAKREGQTVKKATRTAVHLIGRREMRIVGLLLAKRETKTARAEGHLTEEEAEAREENDFNV